MDNNIISATPDLVDECYVPIIIVPKSHEELTMKCLSRWTVPFLKWKIREKTNIYPTNQRLFLEGIELDDKETEYTLATYGIEITEKEAETEPPIQFRIILLEVYRGIPQTYFLDESIFDHKWDCSFEGITDKVLQKRGKEFYIRPLGCVRYGVKIIGKYTDDQWIGGNGYRTEDEWPVAYHGTKEVNVLDILRNGFNLEKGVRFAYGKGIYCTPDPRVALQYAFDYSFNEEPFKLIIQCRVDPKKLQIVVRGAPPQQLLTTAGTMVVDPTRVGTGGGYWLVPDGSAIRPYGICVFPVRKLQMATTPKT